jgi:hypothetical protein
MISGNLEYLMSSLPELSFPGTVAARRKVYALLQHYAATEEEEPDLIRILDDEAAKFLSRRDLSLLQNIRLDRIYQPEYQASRCRLLARFAQYDAQLRQQVADLRKRRRNNGAKEGPPPGADWLASGDPLHEESQLQQLRWQQVEELASGHYADLAALVAYKLKLLILRRQWSFDARRGTKLFRELTKARGL